MENEAAYALVSGLTTDGAHHKQYYLEKALRLLVGEASFEAWLESEDWERGIPA